MRHVRSLVIAALAVGALALASTVATAGGPPTCTGQQCEGPGGVCLDPVNQQLTTPSITCIGSTGSQITLQICGTGTYGAPAGFSVQMKTKAEFDADYNANPNAPCENRGWSTSPSYKAWSLSGQCQAGNSPWKLASAQCVELIIDADFATRYADNPLTGMCGASGDQVVLQCGTEYVFRVFAHNFTDASACPKLNLSASDKGPLDYSSGQCVSGIVCRTADCPGGGGCTYTWGYWKTHGPDPDCSPGNQANEWGLNSFLIGGDNLDQAAVCAILQDPPKACGKGGGANAVLILEHQLIAAMLNVANGAISCPFANQAIIDANAKLETVDINDCVGASTVLGQEMIGIAETLAAYNSDICDCPVPAKPQAVPGAATDTKPSTWGKVKVRYR